jgi:hypothetical protein
MASVAQVNANRFKALTYGLEARSRVIPGEDPAQLEALASGYRRQFNPASPLEDYLVETIVAADWNRRRYTRVESQLYRVLMAASDESDALSSLAAAFGQDVNGPKVLQAVFRQLASAERSYFRALAELRRAQKERLAQEAETEVDAPPRPQPAAAPAAVPQGGAGAFACQPAAPGPYRPAIPRSSSS